MDPGAGVRGGGGRGVTIQDVGPLRTEKGGPKAGWTGRGVREGRIQGTPTHQPSQPSAGGGGGGRGRGLRSGRVKIQLRKLRL